MTHSKWMSELESTCRTLFIEFSDQIHSLLLLLFGAPGRTSGVFFLFHFHIPPQGSDAHPALVVRRNPEHPMEAGKDVVQDAGDMPVTAPGCMWVLRVAWEGG